ncbi:hypothetical protein [Kitasatospora sp. NBC_01266]|uniref:hypothetical protein n=1 Tax=Kitasatospora sp. NBC_01266 TaxID=2903572 RepID=UPI002E327116|nr:hypothetical protein [Kitasatospora sp. NBC_01266]
MTKATTVGALKKVEFENGTDSFATAGYFRESLGRIGGGVILKGKATPETQPSGQLGVTRDKITGSVVSSSGRIFNRSKTAEPALRVSARIQLSFDFSQVQRHHDTTVRRCVAPAAPTRSSGATGPGSSSPRCAPAAR